MIVVGAGVGIGIGGGGDTEVLLPFENVLLKNPCFFSMVGFELFLGRDAAWGMGCAQNVVAKRRISKKVGSYS